MLLAQKTACVTGASRGIGRAIAAALAREGARVVVTYARNASEAAAVVAAIRAEGGEAEALQADVRSDQDVEALAKAVEERFGSVDILVNNAGITRDTLFLRMNKDAWHDVIDTNLNGVYRVTKAFLRPMLRKRQGRVINIASVAGLVGNAGQANYAAAKAGLIGFTKALAREVGSRGITVNAVVPGFIDTDMTAVLPEELKAKATEQIALGRFGQPEDVAEAVVFLASDRAGYITGQTLVVDGGMTMA